MKLEMKGEGARYVDREAFITHVIGDSHQDRSMNQARNTSMDSRDCSKRAMNDSHDSGEGKAISWAISD